MNRAEFIRLAEKYMGTVYKVALNSTGNAADAEDITQNTFIKLLQSEIEYKNDDHVRKWLIRVAVNEGHDLHRMQQMLFMWWRHITVIQKHIMTRK